MNLEICMLQVMDRPTKCRVIVETKYPILGSENETAYFMVDHGSCESMKDADDAEVYDHWKVYDSLGQTTELQSNCDVMNFFAGIEDIITQIYVDSF